MDSTPEPKRIYVKTMGCKVNNHDSQTLIQQMRNKGYILVDDPKNSDIQVINSCSVTEKADKETRYLTRRYKRENPQAQVVVTGCYAQTDSAKLTSLETVDLVVPNSRKTDLVELLDSIHSSEGKLPAGEKPISQNRQTHFKSSLTLFDEVEPTNSRAFLKIQDGCNGFCSYCLVPYARGASRSVAEANVLTEVSRLADKGLAEIVLAGIHIGDYGEDFQDYQKSTADKHTTPPFAILLGKILERISTNTKLRISSLEPAEVSPELVQIIADHPDRFCLHFHLPLQSGSDRILKMMRRVYRKDEYIQTVKNLRQHFPLANIGADVIPGFPGESEEDFAETLQTIAEAGLNYLHVFPYSKRPNTAAARMPEHLAPEIVKGRANILQSLSKKIQSEYYRQAIGQIETVVWEHTRSTDDRPQGKTSRYLQVVGLQGQEVTTGARQSVKLKGFVTDQSLLGLLV